MFTDLCRMLIRNVLFVNLSVSASFCVKLVDIGSRDLLAMNSLIEV